MRATLRHNVRPSGRKTYTQNCLIGPMIFRVMSTALTYYFFSAVVSLKRAIFSKWVSSLIAHTQDGFVDETFRTDSILRTQIGNLSLKRDPAHHSEFSGAICRSLHRVERGGRSYTDRHAQGEWNVSLNFRVSVDYRIPDATRYIVALCRERLEEMKMCALPGGVSLDVSPADDRRFENRF
jgi:hypothetical protein